MSSPNVTTSSKADDAPNALESSSVSSVSSVSIDQQMQHVLELMEARTRGVASNEEVEAAVSSMLFQQTQQQPIAVNGTATATTAAAATAATAATANLSTAASIGNTSNERDPSLDVRPSVNDSMDLRQRRQTTLSPPTTTTTRKRHHQEIQPDLNDYDEDVETNDAVADLSAQQSLTTQTTSTASSVCETNAPTVTKRPRGRPRKQPVDNSRNNDTTHSTQPTTTTPAMDWTLYEAIPLGKQGAQMMTTFGDGKVPQTAAVAATLRGARLMLQTAIQDARHVRRKLKAIYKSAKETFQAAKQQKPTLKEEWSTEILYRAVQGYDPLSYDPKCGFGMEELQKLFPEEINAYNRWNEMHTKATEDEKVDGAGLGEDGAESSTLAPADASSSADVIGHLNERACQFDLRTTQMHGDWYLKYAVLRQGSFLPRRKKCTSGVDAEWETARQQRRSEKRGSVGAAGVWSHMSAPCVRFLHWLGFDPTSALPPPNEDVTGALAFLGHDFFGRIVEKAILLRNLDVQQQKTTMSDGPSQARDAVMLIELSPGEQLTELEIARAMEDPDIKPVPLYSSAPNKKLGPQLYFGPGFEDRLEMEMDEMMWSSKSSTGWSEDEMKIRQQEDELFSQIAEPPSCDGIAELLRNSPKDPT